MDARADGKQLTDEGDDVGKMAPVLAKLRILCLHGFRTSGKILDEQVTLAKWRPIIDDITELVFLDGPWGAKGPSDVEERFPGPYFEWYQANEDWTEAYGTEEAVSHIRDYAALHGPFDGLLGFSQGAALSAALIGLGEKGAGFKIPNVNFLIIVGGGRSRAPNFKAAYAGNPIMCPSLHMIGDKDFMKPHSEVLAEDFKDPIIIRHPGRHVVPKLGADTAEILKDFLLKQLKFKLTAIRC